MTPSENVLLAKRAAVEILRHNAVGPFQGLPRTAGWGYPEPYTRDLMIALPGFLLTGDEHCLAQMRQTLITLADNQTMRGHIPSLAHDPENRGASDTTPLFLWGLAIFRQHVDEPAFLQDAAQRAITWMSYQSCDDRVIVSQLPTTDWRDEHWVLGHGLYVNAMSYAYLRMYQLDSEADLLGSLMNGFESPDGQEGVQDSDGLASPEKPYYSMAAFKSYHDHRFDLLGNSLAILFGIASTERSLQVIDWVEHECERLRTVGELGVNLPPCLLPYMQPGDLDWRPRYAQYNQPGEYHNGGIWPFICGFYIAACVTSGRYELALARLEALAHLVKPWHEDRAEWGFNEQMRAQTGKPIGRDWQTWSAAMFLYAERCVQTHSTPWFDSMRKHPRRAS